MSSRRFGPERIAILPVIVFALGSLPAGAASPWLAWILLLPVLALVWVLRARVVGDADGVEVCNGLARRRYPWSQVAGFDVPKRGFVRLLLTGGEQVPLTALPRRQLPALVEVGESAA